MSGKPCNCHYWRDRYGQIASKHSTITSSTVSTSTDHNSQLAVDLALRFNGEIINGDAMQMYDGLPIITNKITPEEQRGVPHHLLGCVRLDEEPWRVGKFVKSASGIIADVHSRKRTPILVGGTHYYTQSLLFNDKLTDVDVEDQDAKEEAHQASAEKWPILEASTPEILSKLREVDPIMADRWHPEDRRKIRRSLEIWLQTGKKASEIYEAQRQRKKQEIALTESQDEDHVQNDPEEPQPTSTGLRFPTLFLWVHTPSEALRPRLDARVETMLTSGLLDEVLSLSRLLTSQPAHNPIDQTRGIWVSIGYKEFAPYCATLQDPTANTNANAVEQLKRHGVERTQIATRQYAKRQVKWIQSKLLSALRDADALDRMFVLDSSSAVPAEWETAVLAPAERLAALFLSGEGSLPSAAEVLPAAEELLRADREDLSGRRDLWERRTCEICGVTAVTAVEWGKHTGGRKHRMSVRAHAKRMGEGTKEAEEG